MFSLNESAINYLHHRCAYLDVSLYSFILSSPRVIYQRVTPTSLIVHCFTHTREEKKKTGPASYLRAGVHWGSAPTARILRLWGGRSFVSCSPGPRARSWGFSSRLWSLSAMLDLLDAKCRRNVQADNSCWRTSASSVIPLVQSATGMSCLNALPVELVSLFLPFLSA